VAGPPGPSRRPTLLENPSSTSDVGSWRTRAPRPPVPAPQPAVHTPNDPPSGSINKSHPPRAPQPAHPRPLRSGPHESVPAPRALAETTKPAVKTTAEPPTPTKPAAIAVDALTIGVNEVLEEFDFGDMAKWANPVAQPAPDAEVSTALAPSGFTLKPRRPMAADFFEPPAPASPSTEPTSWRRKAPEPSPVAVPAQRAATSVAPETRPNLTRIESQATHGPDSLQPRSSMLSPSMSSPMLAPLRSPTSPTFREAPMSTLDDTISRIRGAMTTQSPHTVSSLQLAESSDMPATVPQNRMPTTKLQLVLQPTESFVTRTEPPQSPGLAWNVVKVVLPKHRPRPMMSRKQVHFATDRENNMRWDILSWNPPVAGMSNRTLSLNDILFPRSFLRSQVVALPKPSAYRVPAMTASTGPVVNLPAAQSDARALASIYPVTNATSPFVEGLNTTSRSPPPDVVTTKSSISATAPVKDEGGTLSRNRTVPKMPEGSSLAFYRQPSTEASRSNSVNFTVNSELERDSQSMETAFPAPLDTAVVSSPDISNQGDVSDQFQYTDSMLKPYM
jgi:serine/arginine repetitive matrix protein 2